MNRVHDYIGFAVRFLGFGYMALWPLTAPDGGLAALDMSFLCVRPLALVGALCHLSPALQLSPGLHLVGTLSAASVLTGLALRPLRRWRRKGLSGEGKASPDIGVRLKQVHRPPPPPRRYVRPRSQFGLRGAPHAS